MKREWIVSDEDLGCDGAYYSYTEIVRCKECRFYLQSIEKCELVDTRLRFYETDKTWTEDCFCSWGERREDETN